MLLPVKELKQDQQRIYFRLPAGTLEAFSAACGFYGSYQNVLSRFAEHFARLDDIERDALMRQMAIPARPAIPGDIDRAGNARTGDEPPKDLKKKQRGKQ